ncbi:MAG: NAD-dependent dihydropyrimidine dehydrogenase subunit PreA [Paludibacteraceae bacterium]|nr:NAD-dependent dihydropyrimidine dehydrogenase subunit PreA [Paludibacteraceae bacterium]
MNTNSNILPLPLLDEARRCLLCHDAPCSAACASADPARALRAIRFHNTHLAGVWLRNADTQQLQPAEQACIHPVRPIPILDIARNLPDTPDLDCLPDLSIDFCGIPCENPFFLASSAVCTNYGMIASALRAGWAGVFYKTISMQDIREVSPRFDAVSSPFFAFRNMEQLSENPADIDFDILRRLKQDFPSKVIIASILGADREEWSLLAQKAERAGLDAVELNFSCPQMKQQGLGSDVGQNPDLVAEFTAAVRNSVSIPVIPKMTPNLTHISLPATAAVRAGADAISAINTVKSVTMSRHASVAGQKTVSGLSGRAVKPIALRFILELAQSPELRNVPLSGVGGIETWQDALDFIQLGCSNLQVCTAIMQYGYRIIDDLTLGLQHHLLQRNVSSLSQLVGEQINSFTTPAGLDRETQVLPVFHHDRCIGCGRCFISCSDGGHQAIRFSDNDRQPSLNVNHCVGCLLCSLVCPSGAISASKRIRKHDR